MKDFFRFRSELLEGKKEQKHKDKSKELTELDKDEDDPCWDGYVQLGTKIKNGKEVPNCVPMEEARKQMKNESAASYERDLDPNKKIVVKGNKGMNSKPFIKKFRNMKAADKWMDDNEDDVEIRQVMNESTLVEGYYDAPDYGTINEAKVTDDHWAIVKRNGSFYSGKSEILKIVKPDLRGNPPSMKMINTYGGDAAVKVGELKKALKGKRNTDKLMKQLTESKTVEVSVRDARKANDIASDMFRGEYKTDGSNTFVFKKADAADDFRAELEKQRIELLEETKPKSGDREAYKKFFNKALKKFGADSLADLDDDQKEFFNYVDENWKAYGVHDDIDRMHLQENIRQDALRVFSDGKGGMKKILDWRDDRRAEFITNKGTSATIIFRGREQHFVVFDNTKRPTDAGHKLIDSTKDPAPIESLWYVVWGIR